MPILIGATHNANAQNVGIGVIPASNTKLHIKTNNPEIIRIESTSPYISFFESSPTIYKSYLWHEGTGMRLGSALNEPVFLYSNYMSGTMPVTVLPNGNVGVANVNPLFKLDVTGTIRLRHQQSTAGIWFNNTANNYSPGFMGVYDDQHLGFYASASANGWNLIMNADNGKLGIGTEPGIAKLKIEASNGIAVEVSGGIKCTGSVKPVFSVTANSSNLYDLNYRGYYRSIIIDHPLCNADPYALLFSTALNFSQAVPYLVSYDNTLGKWKITIAVQTTAKSDNGFVTLSYRNAANDCLSTGPVITFDTVVGFEEGDAFNILVIKR